MKLGLQINRFTWEKEPQSIPQILAKITTTAEDAGFYSEWVMDHFFQISYVGDKSEPMLEGYTTLGFMAGLTKKVKLGTLVTGVIYRYPALLVKAVTTLDVLSNGRAYFGVGAAWNEEEYHALGFAFPPLKTRFEQLEDTLQLAKQMWKGDAKEFKGKQFTVPNPINRPQVLTKPHPPIMIGGGGEKKTLKLVAQYGDACNLFVRLGNDVLKEKLAILKQHCKDVGRTYDDIEKTALDQVLVDENFKPEEFIEKAKELSDLGFTHLIIGIRNVQEIQPLVVFGEKIIPRLKKI